MKSMKSRINTQFIAVALISIFVTLFSIVSVVYEVFKNEIMEDLKTYTQTLVGTGVFDTYGEYSFQPNNDMLRVTVINQNGEAIYDTSVDVVDMDNHGHRPEVEEAFETGYGEAIRRSDTMDTNTFYYAMRLSDGCVLRVAKEAGSVLGILYQAIPAVILIVVILSIASLILAHFLTKSMIRPIEIMAKDMDQLNYVDVYKELAPFVDTIQKQHKNIMKNAMMRQEFTANVSHELKTPLTSISGYAELIENGMATSQDTVRFASEIHKNAKRLLTLINDIIRLSELDVTDNNISFEECDLFEIANNCVDMLSLNAEKQEVHLEIEGEKKLVLGNKNMLEELVYNLIDNAIRYNRKNGQVTVSVKEEDERVVLKVIDTGIGIKKEDQERIFERFYRVDKSRSKSTGGTGLGLAIVKHIVAQHAARIFVNSELDKGTEIKVVF